METQDQGKRDGNKWRGEQPWAGLATSSPSLIYPSPVAQPWHISSREGQGLHSSDSPQGLRPSEQRASASPGCLCQAPPTAHEHRD